VGKSSLLNALLGEERVIVTPVPGTTRDVIEESINLNGLPVVLWDTAGIHETEDQIERIGVKFSRDHVEKADAVVFVLDGSVSLTDDDRTLIGAIAEKRSLVAINKEDLPSAIDLQETARLFGAHRIMHVSAKTGAGVDDLKKSLRALLTEIETEPSVVITNLRHRSALVRGAAALEHALIALGENHAPEFISVDLNQAAEALEEILGKIHNDNILERIFSNFCIGK
jgi:tRNA modification GTPase